MSSSEIFEFFTNSVISRILSNGDTSVFDPSTDGLQPVRDQIVTIDDFLDTEIAKLLSLVTNKRGLRKVDTTWYLYVRNAADDADILLKELNDKDGDDITDIQTGAIAIELASSV